MIGIADMQAPGARSDLLLAIDRDQVDYRELDDELLTLLALSMSHAALTFPDVHHATDARRRDRLWDELERRGLREEADQLFVTAFDRVEALARPAIDAELATLRETEDR